MCNLYDYTGVIHVHSVYSFDGRISVPDILEAARANGIDFIMLTDHSNVRAREEGFEGWQGDTLLVIGQEIAPRFNHYLAFQINEPIIVTEDAADVDPQVYMNDVQVQGGIGFIAHPDHGGTKLFHVKHYPWINWGVTGYTGMGIWDFMTDWQGTLTGYFKALFSYLFPAFVLKGPKEETLRRWDQLNKDFKVVGIGELDNHDTMKRMMGLNLSVFPFTKAFKLVRTHVLTEGPFTKDDKRDIELLISALKHGRVYVAQEYYHEAKGFSFVVQDNGRSATMGDVFILDGKACLDIMLPTTAKIRIIRGGIPYREEITNNMACSISEKGEYRVEAYLKVFGKYLPWIFSNPIYVK
ncbi:MAG TPA: CehA/McbA family metallohydrolase [Syntrophales bacterium]|nr:CehA/McbA family metallohydrolase [Syntrophales bacterium]